MTSSEALRTRVLVVDDDASLAEMLSIVLRNEGFEPPGLLDRATRRCPPSGSTSPTWCCST